ncbi:hypothetical protein C4K24_1931 [Pseudomonas chlororaphis subsp. aurantiaca]|uniref:PIN-like domain-containing protein n=1 Tax=Pseudomonas chlororaphis TaxID=587753 RepID=UPI000F56938E|nr:PIN-like domain-containing protein [Pseudomonas chlororaphis]AZD21244.1 hypothetical protein C4K24_1931 [Pseudomonas chlororaphis subsp. aurantiaca]
MKKEFPGYFANHADDIERLWGSCLFVLDANVLLSLYRYSDATRSELIQVFNSLSDRLWVPHQVAHEYLVNRLQVIGEQVKIYDDSIKKIDALRNSLENNNYHPFVSAASLRESVVVFDKLVEELGDNKAVHEARINLDEIKGQLEVLLENRVGEGFDRARLEVVLKDGKVRYEQKIPPGFSDAKKGGDSIVFYDLCKPYGDYIVWLQMIEKAKASNKPVIFVTGDSKEDWWVSFQGRTIGPRPQLIEEFMLETGNAFYMYSPDRFMERANLFLKQETSIDAMNEIRSLSVDEDADFLDAINKKWSSSSVDVSDFVDLPWNDEYVRQMDELEDRKQSLTRQGLELHQRLQGLKDNQRLFSKSYDNMLTKTSEVVGNHEIHEIRDQLNKGHMYINSIEYELSLLREQVLDVIKQQKALARSYEFK